MSDVSQPGISVPPPPGGSLMQQAMPQSYSAADLMKAYGDAVTPAVVLPTGDPKAFLASADGNGYRAMHQQVKQAQIAGTVTVTPKNPTMQALLAPDALATVAALHGHTDPVAQGAAAGIMSLHGNNNSNGFDGAQADYVRVDEAFKQGLITDPKLGKLYRRFKDEPTSLTPDDANELNTAVAQVASATDVIANPHLKLRVGKVTSIDSTPAGQFVQVQFDPKQPLDPSLVESLKAADTSLPVIKPSGTGLGVYAAPDGTVGVVAASTPEVATRVRHLYPALVHDGVARWAPGAPRKVADAEALRRRLDENSVGHIGETYDATQLAKVGGHPAMVPGTHILLDIPEGNMPDRLRGFGQIQDLGKVLRSTASTSSDDYSDRVVKRARRLMITVAPEDAANVAAHANEILDTGNGTNVSLYTHADVPGFTKAREHLFTDGVTVHAHRTVDPEHSSSHGFHVWVKDTGLPDASPEGQPVRVATFTPQADGTLANDMFGRVVPTGTGEFKTHGQNILKATRGGASVVGFGVFNSGRSPDVVLAFDEQTAAQLQATAEAYGKPNGNGVEVSVDQSLMPAATVVEAMRVIGIDPSKVVLPGQPTMTSR